MIKRRLSGALLLIAALSVIVPIVVQTTAGGTHYYDLKPTNFAHYNDPNLTWSVSESTAVCTAGPWVWGKGQAKVGITFGSGHGGHQYRFRVNYGVCNCIGWQADLHWYKGDGTYICTHGWTKTGDIDVYGTIPADAERVKIELDCTFMNTFWTTQFQYYWVKLNIN